MAGSASPPRPRPLLARLGTLVFRYRDGLFPLLLLLLLGGFRPVHPWAAERNDWLDVAGLALALIGQAWRVAVIGYAYIRRGGKDRQVYATSLQTAGFFALSRNPLYLGNLLILGGLFLINNNPWVYALGVPFFLVAYSAIVAAEEAYLAARFGAAYADYCRRVPRWLPDLRRLPGTLQGMRFDWRRVVVKEYGSAYAWMVGAVLLLAYGRASSLTAVDRGLVAIALLALTAGWIAARYYKKRVFDQTLRSQATSVASAIDAGHRSPVPRRMTVPGQSSPARVRDSSGRPPSRRIDSGGG